MFLRNKDRYHNFYLIHATKDLNSLIEIIQDKEIKIGSGIKKNDISLFGEGSNNIYLNIFFPDLNNLDFVYPYSILIHPKIIFDKGITFNLGWGFREKYIQIKKEDKKYDNKLIKTQKYQCKCNDRIFFYSKNKPTENPFFLDEGLF